MTTNTEHPFQPGTEVAVEMYGHGPARTSYRKSTVQSAHKTGRFTLKGSRDQWTPRQRDGVWTALRASSDSWRYGCVTLMTGEVAKKIEQQTLRTQFRKVVATLEKLSDSPRLHAEDVLALERLVLQLTREEEQ